MVAGPSSCRRDSSVDGRSGGQCAGALWLSVVTLTPRKNPPIHFTECPSIWVSPVLSGFWRWSAPCRPEVLSPRHAHLCWYVPVCQTAILWLRPARLPAVCSRHPTWSWRVPRESHFAGAAPSVAAPIQGTGQGIRHHHLCQVVITLNRKVTGSLQLHSHRNAPVAPQRAPAQAHPEREPQARTGMLAVHGSPWLAPGLPWGFSVPAGAPSSATSCRRH